MQRPCLPLPLLNFSNLINALKKTKRKYEAYNKENYDNKAKYKNKDKDRDLLINQSLKHD